MYLLAVKQAAQLKSHLLPGHVYRRNDRFLLTSPNDYNKLGVGTTQLYNKLVVYNHKRLGDFKLGNRTLTFKRKPHFPEKVTIEFLLVDLMNNLDNLAEDWVAVLERKGKDFSYG